MLESERPMAQEFRGPRPSGASKFPSLQWTRGTRFSPVTDGRRALPAELAEFLESGVSILVATRDARLRPATLRAMGARVQREASLMTVYIPESTGGQTLANLKDNGQLAATFSRAIDHRTIQVKGRCKDIRRSNAQDREVQERYRRLFLEALEILGLPRVRTERVVYWPSFAVDVAVAELFEQTPGPQAGSRLAS